MPQPKGKVIISKNLISNETSFPVSKQPLSPSPSIINPLTILSPSSSIPTITSTKISSTQHSCLNNPDPEPSRTATMILY